MRVSIGPEQTPRWLPAVLAASLALCSAAVAQNGPAETGKALYNKQCAACHGTDGKPKVRGAPDFSSRQYQQSVKDQKLAQVLSDGAKAVPVHKFSLKPAEIKAVVAHLRALAK